MGDPTGFPRQPRTAGAGGLFKRPLGGRLMNQTDMPAWYEKAWDRKWREGVAVVIKTFAGEDRSVGCRVTAWVGARVA